ncbi:DMT family transporter [Sphingomonas daechungensis]|uniref:DMT family transporter n=1 Tax=Sphingomonas daechungensis TaxID=1176646 RepID=A0ABX6SYU1_9SPHN|nr:DMT family transporter [Sphingomonas daechungensis]QNP42625.1 DMT family transporter [Sphingomonas daechungensis]
MRWAAARHDHDHVVSGILCRIGSGLSFSSMGALLKLASMEGLNAPELVFYRSLFSLPVVLIWVLNRESLASLRPKRPLAHVWRSALGLTSMGLTFQALILLPLADATAINFTAPIFATILSFLILREHVGAHRWAAVALGFVGVLIVARPGGSSLPLLGVTIALIGAVGQAGVTTTLRHLQRSENVAAIVFWFAAAGILVGALLMPVFGQMHAPRAFALVAVGGLAGGVGQLLMTSSLRAPVSVVSPFDYLQIVAATIFGWMLFSDVPSMHTVAGAALITGSGIYTAWREHQRRLREGPAAVPAV